MKRIFCDCCGNEMQYDEAAATFTGKNREVTIGTKVKVKMETAITIKPVREMGDNERIDICTNCKWAAIAKFDPRPVVEETAYHNLTHDEIYAIFKRNCRAFPGNYDVSPGDALSIYRAIFNGIRGGSV